MVLKKMKPQLCLFLKKPSLIVSGYLQEKSDVYKQKFVCRPVIWHTYRVTTRTIFLITVISEKRKNIT